MQQETKLRTLTPEKLLETLNWDGGGLYETPARMSSQIDYLVTHQGRRAEYISIGNINLVTLVQQGVLTEVPSSTNRTKAYYLTSRMPLRRS